MHLAMKQLSAGLDLKAHAALCVHTHVHMMMCEITMITHDDRTCVHLVVQRLNFLPCTLIQTFL
jgi:hypothetical protein